MAKRLIRTALTQAARAAFSPAAALAGRGRLRERKARPASAATTEAEVEDALRRTVEVVARIARANEV